MSVRIFDTEIHCFADLNKISTADLLDYYNGLTGKNTKQFSKRAKGMQQIWALIEADVTKQEPAPAAVEGIKFVVVDSPKEGADCEQERAETPELPAGMEAAPATAPSSAEKPALKTQVGALVDFLASGPQTVAEIAQRLKLANEKRARSLIDAARRAGHSIACVGRGTFSLAGE
ncbi:hypothetical protein [Accumulibacter sp.]|uniref:hypothetical protein n=1 Tax=Accumulibacter sp. TaxID=2053492 RepID=UPI002610F927|nr:hypothetical protein [Accumulibacter sp.]